MQNCQIIGSLLLGEKIDKKLVRITLCVGL
jgi:hypothetical protein